MAVLGRLLVGSSERLDLPDLLSIDSFTAADFKFLIQSLVGADKPFIFKGFDIIQPQDSIATESISIRVADSVVYFPGSASGSFFVGLEEGNTAAAPLVPELRKNATNFVYLTFTTGDTAQDGRAFWDPDQNGGAGGEFSQDVNTESFLTVQVNVSVSSFPENTIPIAKVDVGPSVITSITDARDMMFRLGTGGLTPDPFSNYDFRSDPSAAFARQEAPIVMSNASQPNPFQGGDKNIFTLKEWMDVVMTKFKELGGTTFWYEQASSSVATTFNDALANVLKSKGEWSHSDSVPGRVTFTEDIQYINMTDPRQIIFRSNTLDIPDDNVAYVSLVREADINGTIQPVDWVNGSTTVNGIVGAFANVSKGDWIKQKSDTATLYLRVEELYSSPNLAGAPTTGPLAQSIKLSATYAGATGSFLSEYTKGEYILTDIQITSRSDSSTLAAGGDFFWLASRTDTIQTQASITRTDLTVAISDADGDTAKCTSISHGLIDGDRVTIVAPSAFANTYKVSVEDADTFYISTTTVSADEVGQTAHYAVVTTGARSTTDGYQLESAEHNFESDQQVTIADTASGYDGTHVINVRSSTTFNIPVASALVAPAPSTGTVSLSKVNVRTQFGNITVIQGESIEIGDADTENILSYTGMESFAQDKPVYKNPTGYNALDGMESFNSVADDDLTLRNSRLTAMMADRVQDRGMQIIGRVNITHETNAALQDITATGNVTIIKPGSPDEEVSLTVSLPVNSIAVAEIDRNGSGGTPTTLTVESLDAGYSSLGENKIILFYRFAGTEIYTWRGDTLQTNGHVNTGFVSEDSSNRNVFVFNSGRIDFNTSTGLLTLGETSCPEVTDILTTDTSAMDVIGTALSFLIDSTNDVTTYNVWYNVTDGANAQTDPSLGDTSIQVDVLAADTASDVATKTAAALDLLVDFSAVATGPVVTVSNATAGPSTGTTEVNSGFTFTSVSEGAIQDIDIIISGSSDVNTIDSDVINGLGTLIIPAGSACWVRVNRFASKIFNQVLTADAGPSVDTNAAGALFVTSIADVPIDQDVFVLWLRQGNDLVEMHKATTPDENIYDELMEVVSGATIDDNEITGPVTSGTLITIPLDSNDGDSPQQYVVGANQLEIELNGQGLTIGEDFTEFGTAGCLSNKVTILQDLPIGDKLHFRIAVKGSVYFASSGGGSGGSLQDAYDSGRIISTVSSQPVVITGPGGEKLLSVLGDMEVTGVIDPTGLELTGSASNPLDVSAKGIWVRSADDDLVYEGNAFRVDSIKLGAGATQLTEAQLIALLALQPGVRNTTAVNMDYTAVGTDDVILVDASGGPVVISLPAVAAETGKVYDIKKVDSSANTVTLDPDGAETIDEVSSKVITVQYESFTIVNDGTEWWLI